VEGFVSGPSGGGEAAAANELRDAGTTDQSRLGDGAPTATPWYRRFAKKRSRASQPLSATLNTASAEEDHDDDEEEEEEEVGPDVLLRKSDSEFLARNDEVAQDAFVPPADFFDLPHPGVSLLHSSLPSADLAAAPDFFGSMEPQTFGGFQSYYDSDFNFRPPDHQEYFATLAAPEPLAPAAAPRPVPEKRVAEDDEAQEDAAAPDADGDGRRKKAKRASVDTPSDRSAKKFACPYFKRNPKKYRKWTSCPGPGWDEVHRVKYV
jgi:hypothetical protein